jgi:F420-non-reducing hydrogenase iron-sulfur subunit
MRAVRVMCSGMVHPDLVVEGLQRGADGVIIMG